ncbi:hypothetical protein COCNU_scaffold000320G000010 [Cocos nucifera]|nr:hypothetical protein [Cocos nucifera]
MSTIGRSHATTVGSDPHATTGSGCSITKSMRLKLALYYTRACTHIPPAIVIDLVGPLLGCHCRSRSRLYPATFPLEKKKGTGSLPSPLQVLVVLPESAIGPLAKPPLHA